MTGAQLPVHCLWCGWSNPWHRVVCTECGALLPSKDGNRLSSPPAPRPELRRRPFPAPPFPPLAPETMRIRVIGVVGVLALILALVLVWVR